MTELFSIIICVFFCISEFLDKFRHKQKESKVSFRIYADSVHNLKRAKDLLDDIFVEENLYPIKQVVEDLKDRQVRY